MEGKDPTMETRRSDQDRRTHLGCIENPSSKLLEEKIYLILTLGVFFEVICSKHTPTTDGGLPSQYH